MSRKRIDLTGAKIGLLTVVKPDGFKQTSSGSRQYFWQCLCQCGQTCSVDACCLRRESTKSCGCQKNRAKHGMADTPIYGVWLGMKARCENRKHKNYCDYGGRGIAVCERWHDFANFYADMGDRPTPQHTLERKDNGGPYEPSNCIWATRAQQNENTRQTKLLTYQGATLSIGKWAKRLKMSRKTIAQRLSRGWSVERALSTPSKTAA